MSVDVKALPSSESLIRSVNTPRPEGIHPAPVLNASGADGVVAKNSYLASNSPGPTSRHTPYAGGTGGAAS